MSFSAGQLNGRVLALLGVLIAFLVGYSWWQYMYTPAVDSRNAQRAARDTAQQGLDVDKQKLADAKASQVGDDGAGEDDSKEIGRIQIAKTAIPRGDTLLPAVQQIERMVRSSGVTATISDITNEAASTGTSGGPSTSSSLQLEGHATFASLLSFVREINDTGRVYRGKVYISNRLLRVGSLKIDTESASSSSIDPLTGAPADSSATDIPKGHISFSMTIIFYMEPAGASTAAPEAGDAAATGSGGTTTTGTGAAGSGQGTQTGSTGSGGSVPATQASANPAGAPSGTPASASQPASPTGSTS